MPDGLRHIQPLIIGALESALNRYLTLDEQRQRLLAPLAGKVIALQISSFDTTLYLCPTLDSIQLLETYHGEVDATLSGSLSALGLMGLSATPMRALFRGEVKMSGDTAAAQQLQKLFAKLDIQLESKLAAVTGEKFAQGLSSLLRGGRDWGRQSIDSFRQNLEEFLQEETRDLPAKPEAELLFQDIDTCRSDFDRLNARIERLSHALTSANPHHQPGTSQ